MRNAELDLALSFIRDTRCNLFLTGRAGTGKTTFLHRLKEQTAKRLIVTAPTGVAAINAGGMTIHSFFQLPFGPLVPGSEFRSSQRQRRFSKEKIHIIRTLDLLVIDEVSMVRPDLLDGIDTVLRRYRRSSLPFGGVQLLMIGDLYQLPPVVRDEHLEILRTFYDSIYFFSSKALARSELITIELQHVYRQSDKGFIDLLNRIRDNRLDQDTLETLNRRYLPGFRPEEGKGYITLCTHNQRAETINRARLRELDRQSHRFPALVDGEFPEHAFPTAQELELKEGAQVMFIRNDTSDKRRYFNGRIGQVTKIRGSSVWVRCPEDDQDIEVEPAVWENIRYRLDGEQGEIREERLGSFSQYPLKLAWAITIHKSQGLTFERAVIDARHAFACGQVYVALSRCRDLEGMVLSAPLDAKSVQTDSVVVRFMSRVTASPPTRKQLEDARNRYQQELILECFSFRQYRFLLNRLVYLLLGNVSVVRVLGVEDLGAAREELEERVCAVAENFQRQLQGLFRPDREPGSDPVVMERLAKASAYFGERLETGPGAALPALQVETDNSELGKRIKRYLDEFREETAVRLAAVQSCRQGFSPPVYLRAISSAAYRSQPKGKKKTAKHTVEYRESDVGHPELFARLKQWRADQAVREGGKPHYQIMHQRVLVQIAVNLPDNLADLVKIRGIGKRTAEKYGSELVALVRKYRQEHAIREVVLPEPGEEQPVEKTETARKKNTREISLDMFRSGMTVEEVASKRGLLATTIEGHLATFVKKGELSLDQVLPQDRRKVIAEKLDTMQTESLSEIYAALGGDYSYGEIKLVLAHRKRRNAGETHS